VRCFLVRRMIRVETLPASKPSPLLFRDFSAGVMRDLGE